MSDATTAGARCSSRRTQRTRQNIFAVRDAIYERVDAFERGLPAGVDARARLRPVTQRRTAGCHAWASDFAIAIVLVLLTLLPLGFRASLVVMISIPLSLAIGLALLHVTGFTLNQLSIVGFVIALGLLVDDSIVVVENIARFLRAGYTRDRGRDRGHPTRSRSRCSAAPPR